MSSIEQTLSSQIIGLAHAGFIVNDLMASIASFKHIYGVTDQHILVFPEFDVTGPELQTRFAFITINDTDIELIQPLNGNFKELVNSAPCGGGGINHLAWQVKDLDRCVAILAKINIKPGYVTPTGVIDTGAKKMVYLDPGTTDGLYIELIEIKQAAKNG